MAIGFNKAPISSVDEQRVLEALRGQICGDGRFTKLSQGWLEEELQVKRALLTHSCTAALEMAAILLEIEPGDEVIMPSFTFVSTANAFVLRGAKPVFVDISLESKNIDPSEIEKAITNKTKAIVPVHYAGVGCDMDSILSISSDNNIPVVEDAAQGLGSFYKDKPLGSFGSFATLSFHETKNIVSGEGGALLINNSSYVERAEIIREKGTNRSKFIKGQVDKYTWCDLGSSFLPSDILAALLSSQLERSHEIKRNRIASWEKYHSSLKEFEDSGLVKRHFIPEDCEHNAHMYYFMLPDKEKRDKFIKGMKKLDISCAFHYIPLHSSPAGNKYGRACGSLDNTSRVSDTIVRLPLWVGVDEEKVIESARKVLLEL